jgi:L-malate glycosyltransferase
MTAPARPCIVQVILSLGRGGLEAMAVDLAIGLQERGARSVVVALDEGGILEERLQAAGVEYSVLKAKRAFSWPYHTELVSVLRGHRVDVVHTHMFAPLVHALPAALRLRVRLAHTEHSSEYLHERPAIRRLLRLMSRRTTAFTLVGDRMRAYYLETVGINESRLSVIPNGIAVAAGGATREALRAELGIRRDAFVVASAGRLAPEKNYQMLLRAVASSRKAGVDIRILLFGDGSERETLVSLATELGISDLLTLPGWRVDLSRLLPAADAFSLTSFSEGLPLALLEGMAHALTPVCTPVGDIPEIIHEGCSGFLVPLDRVDLLAERLQQLALDPGRRRTMGDAAREIVSSRYSREAMIRQYLAAYRLSSLAPQS